MADQEKQPKTEEGNDAQETDDHDQKLSEFMSNPQVGLGASLTRLCFYARGCESEIERVKEWEIGERVGGLRVILYLLAHDCYNWAGCAKS